MPRVHPSEGGGPCRAWDTSTMHSKSQAITHSSSWSFGTVAAIPRHSETLPHPVAARNDAALLRVGDALNKSGHANGLANPLHCEAQLMRDIQHLHAGLADPAAAPWADMNRAMYAACCLAFLTREGPVLHATDPLEATLYAAPAGTLTTSQFQPPHPACYVHFGPRWSEQVRERLGPALALTGVAPGDTQVNGCYLLQTQTHCESCGRDQRTLGLYIVVEFNDQPGAYALTGGGELVLHDEDAPLAETLTRKLDFGVPGGLLGEVPSFTVGLLAGLFDYMRSPDARVVEHRDRSELMPRLRLVGTKKSGKLSRRLERAYDWTEVGPVAACQS